MRLERVVPGRRPPPGLEGAILTRDLAVAGERWSMGRRRPGADLRALAAAPPGHPVSVLIPDADEIHEDAAALRLATAVTGGDPGVTLRGPAQSRVDLVAAVPGVVAVRLAALERVNRLDPLEVFTVFDGQVVEAGTIIAAVKVGPHLVRDEVLLAGEAIARRGGPLVRVRPFRATRIAVLVKEHIAGAARERFEASVRAKAAGLGAELAGIDYVPDETAAVTEALGSAVRGPRAARIVLTAGGASTDPADPFYLAVSALGGRMVRHGVPSHPGSMLWLGRVGRTAIVGLPSCGAYSKATAVDLLLPRLVAGEPASAATVARLAHGGILTRTQRFRFPAYARDLDAPDG
ncbi:MAG: molybdopterin-binding protein [Chloroflexota bacterium]